MHVRLKPVEDQVIVITGASSGIGLATARMAAARGARVVLASRDESALRQAAEEIRGRGGQAVHAVVDVADERQMQSLADTAIRSFGGFDTWINNAGVSIYGRIPDIPVEEERRLFDTNYWGVVNGSRVALGHLRRHGGALINLGSIVSDQAIPLQTAYSASKHAVKGFTNGLRMELDAEDAPVSVTLIKPSAIDTMFEIHARNHLPEEATLPPPLYAPELVAEAILHAAEHPVRSLVVGGAGKAMTMMGRMTPRIGDWMVETGMMDRQRTGRRAEARPDSLYAPSGDGHVRSGRHPNARRTSVYTSAELHPLVTAAIVAGLGAAAAAVFAAGRNGGIRAGRKAAWRPGSARAGDGSGFGRDRMTLFGGPGAPGAQGPDDPLEDRPGAGAMA